MVFDAFCDDHGDCAAGERCFAVVGDIVRVTCAPAQTKATCDASAGYHRVCTSDADCAGCGTCKLARFADWQTSPGTALKFCQ